MNIYTVLCAKRNKLLALNSGFFAVLNGGPAGFADLQLQAAGFLLI
jgi:hypothetical protein